VSEVCSTTPAAGLAGGFHAGTEGACPGPISKAVPTLVRFVSSDPDGTLGAQGDQGATFPAESRVRSTTHGMLQHLTSSPRDGRHHGHYEKTVARHNGRTGTRHI